MCYKLVSVAVYFQTNSNFQFVQSSLKLKLKLKLKLNKALDENSSLSYGASPAIWDDTV